MNQANLQKQRESLNFNLDDGDCISDRLSYSTDGTDFDFIFEQEPYDQIHSFNQQNSQTAPQKKSKRKRLFDKYCKLIRKQSEQQSNDILTQFDKIFEIKATPQEKKQQKQNEGLISKLFRKKKQNSNNTPITITKETKNEPMKENRSSLDNLSAIEIRQPDLQNDHKPQEQKKQLKKSFGIYQQPKKDEITTRESLGEFIVQQNKSDSNLSGSNVSSVSSIGQPKFKKPKYEQEERIPYFLRKLRYLNSIYPNFLNKNLKIQDEIKKISELFIAAEESHATLNKIAIDTINFVNRPKYFNKSMASLTYFLTSGWQKIEPIPNIQLIKPWNNVALTKIKPQMILQALGNYKDVINYYKSANSTQSLKKMKPQEFEAAYKKVREKLWAVEKNLRFISQDVYKLALQREHPNYVYWYLNILRSPMPKKGEKRVIEEHKRILGIIIMNRQHGQALSCSQVGIAVKNKIQRELNYLCPF